MMLLKMNLKFFGGAEAVEVFLIRVADLQAQTLTTKMAGYLVNLVKQKGKATKKQK